MVGQFNFGNGFLGKVVSQVFCWLQLHCRLKSTRESQQNRNVYHWNVTENKETAWYFCDPCIEPYSPQQHNKSLLTWVQNKFAPQKVSKQFSPLDDQATQNQVCTQNWNSLEHTDWVSLNSYFAQRKWECGHKVVLSVQGLKEGALNNACPQGQFVSAFDKNKEKDDMKLVPSQHTGVAFLSHQMRRCPQPSGSPKLVSCPQKHFYHHQAPKDGIFFKQRDVRSQQVRFVSIKAERAPTVTWCRHVITWYRHMTL